MLKFVEGMNLNNVSYPLYCCIKKANLMFSQVDRKTTPPTYKLYTHKKLDVGYNGKQVRERARGEEGGGGGHARYILD